MNQNSEVIALEKEIVRAIGEQMESVSFAVTRISSLANNPWTLPSTRRPLATVEERLFWT